MIFIIVLAASVLSIFIPVWWITAPVAFVAGIRLGKSSRQSFWPAFFANAFVWLIAVLWQITGSNHLLLEKMTRMFLLPHWSILVLVAALLGGLVSGLASLAGYRLKDINLKKPPA